MPSVQNILAAQHIPELLSSTPVCYDLAKWLSHYLLYFTLLFLFGPTIQGRSVGKCHMTNVTHHSHMSGCHMVMSHDDIT